MKLPFLLSILFSILICSAHAQEISGTVSSDKDEMLPYVSVIADQSTVSTVTNQNGEFSLILSGGSHLITFSYLGYELYEVEVELDESEELVLEVILTKSAVSLAEAEVIANSRDRAKEIMKEVRDARKGFLKATDNYEVSLYQFISLESKLKKPNKSDSLTIDKSSINEKTPSLLENEILEVTEQYSTVYYKSVGKYKEYIKGVNTYDESELEEDIGRMITTGSGTEFGENVITPQFQRDGNVWVIIKGAKALEFNLYESLLNYDVLSDKPILSPLAPSSALSYKFDYKGVKNVNGVACYSIELTPLNKTENLLSGVIYFDQDTYAMVSYNLEIEGGNLIFANSFSITAALETDSLKNSVVTQQEIEYTISNGRRVIQGKVISNFSDYKLNSPELAMDFNREIKFFDPAAYDRDTAFWKAKRGLALDTTTLKFIAVSDSITNYYESPEYLAKLDSAFNKINIWTPLIGYGRRNREKGNEFYIEGLLGQVVPFGIGGYRHRLPGYFEKEMGDDFTLRTEGFLDYGFTNRDLKGKLILGLNYNSAKFMRTRIKLGDYYDMVNDFASLEQTFSRSNFIRTKMIGVAQRMEIINGLYAELSFEYQDQLPLKNLEFSELSDDLFGELNTPLDFERYVKSEFRLQMEYRIRQEYYFKNKRKMVIPSKLPTITLLYRKGVNGLFNSEVNFDYLEIGANQEIQVVRLGSTRWEASIGSFVNQRDLRVLEHKFFRGSDQLVFSDPLRSFQLLGPTLNTPNEYLRANVIHHFEGAILNKVPLIRRLKLGLAIGGGTLNIPDAGFYHGELFAGVEKPFKLWKQMLRGGIYAVTADNSIENSNLTWKVGLTFYQPFTRTWGY
ncbi:MAG: DUF5686 family protein [Flavobacteriales bacterium]